MIQGYARLHRSAPDARRRSYGEGSMRALLERPVSRPRIGPSTTFLGWLSGDRLPEPRQSVGIFAAVSRREGWTGAGPEAITSKGRGPNSATVAARERTSCAQNGPLAQIGGLDDAARGLQVLLDEPTLRERLLQSLVNGATPYELLQRDRQGRLPLYRVGSLNHNSALGAVDARWARALVYSDPAMTSWSKFCRDMLSDREPWESRRLFPAHHGEGG